MMNKKKLFSLLMACTMTVTLLAGCGGGSSSSAPASSAPSGGSTAAPSAGAEIRAGDMVSHRLFGTGLVLSATPMAGDVLVEIAFDKVGTKKLMANFAKLKKI